MMSVARVGVQHRRPREPHPELATAVDGKQEANVGPSAERCRVPTSCGRELLSGRFRPALLLKVKPSVPVDRATVATDVPRAAIVRARGHQLDGDVFQLPACRREAALPTVCRASSGAPDRLGGRRPAGEPRQPPRGQTRPGPLPRRTHRVALQAVGRASVAVPATGLSPAARRRSSVSASSRRPVLRRTSASRHRSSSIGCAGLSPLAAMASVSSASARSSSPPSQRSARQVLARAPEARSGTRAGPRHPRPLARALVAHAVRPSWSPPQCDRACASPDELHRTAPLGRCPPTQTNRRRTGHHCGRRAHTAHRSAFEACARTLCRSARPRRNRVDQLHLVRRQRASQRTEDLVLNMSRASLVAVRLDARNEKESRRPPVMTRPQETLRSESGHGQRPDECARRHRRTRPPRRPATPARTPPGKIWK